jgi:hypothetical protein
LVSLVSGSLRLSNSKGIVVAIITDETKSKATNVNFVLMIACNFLIVLVLMINKKGARGVAWRF